MVGGKYVLQSMIGQGGMGAVFKARHIELEHEVAIKVMFADAGNVEAATRFKNEGRAAARIKSDHVMKVHDVGQEFNYLYMVLELLEGEDLAQVLDVKKQLGWGEAVKYVLEALEGVDKAHALGIVHRDLKPSNLYLAKESDGTVTVKVLDFGISKSSNQSALNQSPSALTSTKAMLGSPLYMSPEQLRSSKSVDARADIWAIGVILYELITGTLPFMGDNLGELFANILEQDAQSLNARGGQVPGELDTIILKCLKRRPEDRWQTVRELIGALRPYASAAPLGGTAFMTSSPVYQSSPGPTGGFASTPQPRPMPPQAGAITGNGSAPRNLPNASAGTMAMAQTPSGGAVPHQMPFPGAGVSTNSSWQNEQPIVPTTKPPILLIGIGAAAVVVIGLVFGGIALKKRSDDSTTTANPPASASVTAPIASPTPSPTETQTAPPATATASAAVTVATTAPTNVPAQPAVHTGPAVKPAVVNNPVAKVDPPKPADPPKPPEVKPQPNPTPKPQPTGASTGVMTR